MNLHIILQWWKNLISIFIQRKRLIFISCNNQVLEIRSKSRVCCASLWIGPRSFKSITSMSLGTIFFLVTFEKYGYCYTVNEASKCNINVKGMIHTAITIKVVMLMCLTNTSYLIYTWRLQMWANFCQSLCQGLYWFWKFRKVMEIGSAIF